MRGLFLALILANLGFAAWTLWFSDSQQPTRPISGSGPGIALYAEAQQQPGATEGDTALTSEPVQASARELPTDRVRCISIGPLPNRVDVEDAVRALTCSGFDSRQRVAPGEVWLGYWVYIDAIATQAAAAEIVARLADNDIGEAYVIADGNNGNIVSLGVFSQLQRAQQRLTDAQALGYTPSISDRSQPGEVFWLDVTRRSGQEFVVNELPALDINPQPQFAACDSGAD